ncbi:hypothetical protein FRC11_003183 [Ceratobasidium sp. 423]|nr:hypothetical protein FRC11_003183 [Ceratobasidium sp. 423]
MLEWVGRAQAEAIDRAKRVEELERARRENERLENEVVPDESAAGSGSSAISSLPPTGPLAPVKLPDVQPVPAVSTLQLLESLTRDLLGFQERFSDGGRLSERERRSEPGFDVDHGKSLRPSPTLDWSSTFRCIGGRLATYLEDLSFIVSYLSAMPIQTRHEFQRVGRSPNKLPREVLSEIFVLCKQGKEKERGYPDLFCLTVLPVGAVHATLARVLTPLKRICRYWRTVALDTKSLWSLITLSDSPLFNFSVLCLNRSGTSIPLDIEIRLSSRLWGNRDDPAHELCASSMTDALNTIIKCGGHLHMAALDFIKQLSLPNLERFEVKHDGLEYKKDQEEETSLKSRNAQTDS